ncbi:MAG: ATP-binding protein [Xanthomonadales bacterium]|nr:ATP-binding protein [Xanthomonadales bacterium]
MPTGVGKSYLARALGQRACREDKRVKLSAHAAPFVDEPVCASAMHKKGAFYKQPGSALISSSSTTPRSGATCR